MVVLKRVKVTDKDYYMDGILRSNLDIYAKIVKEDWDLVLSIDGPEGAGKSVLALQVAYYLDNTFTLDRVVFRHYEFKKAVLNAKVGQAIVWDEALSGLNSRSAMSVVNITICDLLAEIRQKNLFILIVLPTFFDLDKYVALWRSRALIHIYHDRFKRGFFEFYNEKGKKYLYTQGKKLYNYKVAKPNFRGRFTNFYTIDEREYKKKKLASLRATDRADGVRVKKYQDHIKALVCFMAEQGYTVKDVFAIFNERCMDPLTIRSVRRYMPQTKGADKG